jgi:hypothetical protein
MMCHCQPNVTIVYEITRQDLPLGSSTHGSSGGSSGRLTVIMLLLLLLPLLPLLQVPRGHDLALVQAPAQICARN